MNKILWWKVIIEVLWIVWSHHQYVAPTVTVSGGQKKGRGRKKEGGVGKKGRKTETNPFSRFICFPPPLWTLTFHLNYSLTISWMPPNKACCLFICLPLQKDRKYCSKRDDSLIVSTDLTSIALAWNRNVSINVFKQLGLQSILIEANTGCQEFIILYSMVKMPKRSDTFQDEAYNLNLVKALMPPLALLWLPSWLH